MCVSPLYIFHLVQVCGQLRFPWASLTSHVTLHRPLTASGLASNTGRCGWELDVFKRSSQLTVPSTVWPCPVQTKTSILNFSINQFAQENIYSFKKYVQRLCARAMEGMKRVLVQGSLPLGACELVEAMQWYIIIITNVQNHTYKGKYKFTCCKNAKMSTIYLKRKKNATSFLDLYFRSLHLIYINFLSPWLQNTIKTHMRTHKNTYILHGTGLQKPRNSKVRAGCKKKDLIYALKMITHN